jgi:hypothetical protein
MQYVISLESGERGAGSEKCVLGALALSCRFFRSPVGEAPPTGGTLDIKTPQVKHLFKRAGKGCTSQLAESAVVTDRTFSLPALNNYD